MEDCLDNDEIAALAEGQLGPDRLDVLLAHVDTCSVCAEVMAQLGRLAAPSTGAHDHARVGRYQLGRVLGAGAMGVVYEAWDPQLLRRIALKLVRPERADGSARDRTLREARALARISHVNVVAVHDVGEHAGEIYVATELVDGETLATWQRGRSPEAVAGAWCQAARGLAAAHAGGVVHRDVKPSNVLVDREGRVKVGDFGLARVGSDAPITAVMPATAAGSEPSGEFASTHGSQASRYVVGTPGYMAPEQLRGVFDARSDQYALCVALAEGLTGRRPTGADHVICELPRLDAILRRGLREDPDQRFASMDQLADALARALSPAPRASRTRAAVAVLGAVALGSGAWIAWSRGSAEHCAPVALPVDLWSAPRRTALLAHVPPSVLPRVDGWLAAWSSGAADVCVVDRAAPEVRARRERCLRDQLTELAGQLARWETGPRGDTMQVHEAFEQLPHASRCSHAAQRTGAAQGAAELAVAQVLRSALVVAASRDDGDPRAAMNHARALGDAPLVVDSAIQLARRERDRGGAVRVLSEAIAVADRASGELPRLVARIAMIDLLGTTASDELGELTETARTLLGKLDGNAELEARLEFAIATAMNARNRADDTTAAYERARRAFRAAFGGDSLHEIVSLLGLSIAYERSGTKAAQAREAQALAVAINERAGFELPLAAFTVIDDDVASTVREMERMLAYAEANHPRSQAELECRLNAGHAYVLADQPERALAQYRQAIALGDQLGIRSEHFTGAFTRAASVLIDLGRLREARPLARRAVVLAEQLGSDRALGQALVALGRTLTDPRGARAAFQRALTVLDRANAPASDRARARFLLATVLWARDRKRAIDLARGARADAQSVIDGSTAGGAAAARRRATQRKRVDEIDRWLASHRERAR